MAVKVSWDSDDKTRIRYDFEGQWTWEEFREASKEGFALTRSVEHLVDSISYFSAGATLPPGALFQFRRAMNEAPPNRGMTVIVGGSTFIQMMVSAFSKVYKQLGERLALADSLDEARSLLEERRKDSASAG